MIAAATPQYDWKVRGTSVVECQPRIEDIPGACLNLPCGAAFLPPRTVEFGVASPSRAADPAAAPTAGAIDFDLLAERLRPFGNATRLRLLHLLTRPLYLEEIASTLSMSRQGARGHVDLLTDLGVLYKRPGEREFGPVTEYVLSRERLFHVQTDFAKLGALRPPLPTAPALTLEERAPAARRGPGPGPAPRVTIVRGLDEGRIFQLANQPGRVWRIGRSPDAEIPLDYDPYLSHHHAEVRRLEKGFVLVDALSRNGTSLDFAPLDRGESAPLHAGAIVGVGKSLLVFQEHPPHGR